MIARGADAPAQFVVIGERAAPILGQQIQRLGLPGEQMREKPRRAAHGLAGVVHQVIQPRQALGEELREQLDARRMAQVQAMNLQPRAKARKVGLLRVALGCIHGKACGDDDVRAGAKQLQGSLKADFDAPAGHERIVAAEVRRLLALGIVEFAAALAHGVVVAMHDCKGLFAYIAIALLTKFGASLGGVGFRPLQPERRIDLGAPLHAQPRPLDDAAVMLLGGQPFGAPKALEHSRHFMPLGLGDEPGERQQFAPLLLAPAVGASNEIGRFLWRAARACRQLGQRRKNGMCLIGAASLCIAAESLAEALKSRRHCAAGSARQAMA